MIVEAMKGYRAADLPKDAVAGLVIAALSIPIAMGYAEAVSYTHLTLPTNSLV